MKRSELGCKSNLLLWAKSGLISEKRTEYSDRACSSSLNSSSFGEIRFAPETSAPITGESRFISNIKKV